MPLSEPDAKEEVAPLVTRLDERDDELPIQIVKLYIQEKKKLKMELVEGLRVLEELQQKEYAELARLDEEIRLDKAQLEVKMKEAEAKSKQLKRKYGSLQSK